LRLGILEPDVTEFFRALVKDMMEKRKQSKTVRKDFIQLLVELKEKGSISIDAEEEEDKHLESAEMQSALKNTSTYSKILLKISLIMAGKNQCFFHRIFG
jgi:hypothetical protein